MVLLGKGSLIPQQKVSYHILHPQVTKEGNFYSSAEVQSTYSTLPANGWLCWGREILSLSKSAVSIFYTPSQQVASLWKGSLTPQQKQPLHIFSFLPLLVECHFLAFSWILMEITFSIRKGDNFDKDSKRRNITKK